MSDKILGNYTNSGIVGGEVTTTRDSANDKTGLDMNLIGGSAAAGGQSGPGKIIKVALDAITPVDLTQELIDAGQTSFNAQNMQNQSGIEIEFNYVSSWTYGDGWKIPDGTNEYRDLTQGEHIYGLAASGTPDLIVEGIGNTQ